MHGIPASTDEWMPLGKITAVCEQLIGTGAWQPLETVDFLWIQNLAVFDEMDTFGVIAAAAGLGVEQATGHIRKSYFTRVLVFDFVKAALPAAIAKAFPLGAAHLREGFFFPKG